MPMINRRAATAYSPVPFQRDIECMPKQEVVAMQERLLAQAIARARNAPFYRPRLAPLQDVTDVLPVERFQTEVPLTTKQDLRTGGMDCWNTEAVDRIILVLATSGTTGSRIVLPYTRRDVDFWHLLVARTLWTNGFRPEDAVILPVPLGLYTGGQGMFGGLLRLGCLALPLVPATTPLVADALRGSFGFTPTALIGLPSHMLRLMDSLPEIGFDLSQSPLHLASLGAEPWTEAARRRIEEEFGLCAMDSYGIGEMCGPGVASECELRDGMHVWEDAFFVEIINRDTGELVPDGQAGELVLTPMFREALPILRYRTGDEATLLPGSCPCGRTHRRISRIARRLDNVLIVTGVNIDPLDIERILYSFPWLGNEFLLEAGGRNQGTLVVHVERRASVMAPTDAEMQITEQIRHHFQVRTAIQFHDAGQLPRPQGKAQRIRVAE